MSEPAEAKPKRRFWQIHLSTAVLLMVVAALFTWANCGWTKDFYSDGSSVLGRGRPFIFQLYFYESSDIVNSSFMPSGYIEYSAVLYDIAIGAAALLLAGIVSEYLIRRREGREE
jgi:hypothetical protein